MRSTARLYGILDLKYVRPQNAIAVGADLLEGGVDLLQVRAKEHSAEEVANLARKLLTLTKAKNVPLIVNDYVEVAESAAVDGVHVGQDDLPIAEVRARVSRPILVGKSTHSVAQAVAAEKEGADYIGFGPIFTTPTKPSYQPIGLTEIAAVHQLIKIPIFCIGGIKSENLAQVLAAGAKRVVIVSGLLQADNIAVATRLAKDHISN